MSSSYPDPIYPIPARRRHTLVFLRAIRRNSPVHLGTDIDVSALVEERGVSARRYSYVTYVIAALGETLNQLPEANVAIGGSWLAPRLIHFSQVDVKLALDKFDNGVRHVASAVLADVSNSTIDEIQDQVDHLRDAPAKDLAELHGSRQLDRLPPLIGALAFSVATRLSRRSATLGTVALSSLGHSNVSSFHADGGTAVTVGLGAIRQRPVALPRADGGHDVSVRPVMSLNLTFDHRALDGALAADVLTTLADQLTLRDRDE